MTQYINTIKDLEARTYGLSPVGGNQLLKGAGIVGGLVTGHDSAIGLNGTAGPNLSALYNKIYGQKVWSMINQEINPLSVLPKRQYTQSGWRIMTRRPLGGANPAFGIGTTTYSAGSALNTPHADEIGGVQENHALDSTGLQSVAPEYDTLFMSPKTVAHQFAYSELAAEMAKIDDGIGDLRAIVREDMGKLHAEVQSKMLVMPLENYDLDGGGSASPSGAQTYADMERNYTSLHKIISTSSEIHELATQNIIASASGAAASTDIGSLYGNTDRTASTAMGSSVGFMDATINIGDGYAATEQRTLTLSVLNALIQQLRLAGGTPKVILTGFDTIQAIADLLQAQERFIDGKEIIPTHAGVKGGMDIPMIPCKDMPTTTHDTLTTGVSDMLFLDTDHLWFATLKPTQYFEDGINHGNPFGVGTLGNKGMFRTMGEVGCSFFKGQGKITNIK